MRACIILHNAMMEKRIRVDEELDKFYDLGVREVLSYVRVGNICAPLWTKLKRDVSPSHVPVRTLAALCEFQEFLKNGEDYPRLHRLIMEHLWSKNGEA